MVSSTYLVLIRCLVAVALLGQPCSSSAQSPSTGAIPEIPWVVKCADGHCLMEIDVPFERGHGVEHSRLAVALDQKTKSAEYVAIYLPPDVDSSAGASIGFWDIVLRDKKWTATPSSKVYSLPIMECTTEACVSRVHQMLDNDDGTYLDLLAELQKHGHLWVAFTRRGETTPVSISIPIYKFRDEFLRISND